jgi:hypothetical protein
MVVVIIPEYRVRTNSNAEVVEVVQLGGIVAFVCLIGSVILSAILVTKVVKMIEWFALKQSLFLGLGIFMIAVAVIILISLFFIPDFEHSNFGYLFLIPGSALIYSCFFINYIEKDYGKLTFNIDIERDVLYMWKYALLIGPYLVIAIGITCIVFLVISLLFTWIGSLFEK